MKKKPNYYAFYEEADFSSLNNISLIFDKERTYLDIIDGQRWEGRVIFKDLNKTHYLSGSGKCEPLKSYCKKLKLHEIVTLKFKGIKFE